MKKTDTLTKQFVEANRSAMFKGHPQVMTIAYTAANKQGKRKALRYLTKWSSVDAGFVNNWVDISFDQIKRLKTATKRLKSVQGFAVLTNQSGKFEDWKIEVIEGRI